MESREGPDMTEVRVLVQFCMFRVQKLYVHEIYRWFCMILPEKLKNHVILTKNFNFWPISRIYQKRIQKYVKFLGFLGTLVETPVETPCGDPCGSHDYACWLNSSAASFYLFLEACPLLLWVWSVMTHSILKRLLQARRRRWPMERCFVKTSLEC